MNTYIANKTDIKNKKWYVVDAEGKVLGRLSTRVAEILRGKNKSIFTPNLDCGDFVVVVNADKVKLTGKKEEQKNYKRFSGYPGGLKLIPLSRMRQKHPGFIVENAVKHMIPSGPLGRSVFKKLKVYAGPNHPHQAQNPELLKI